MRMYRYLVREVPLTSCQASTERGRPHNAHKKGCITSFQTSIDIEFFFRSNRVGKNSVLEISKILFYEIFYILRFDQYRRIPKQFSADTTQSSFDRWQYTVYILSCMIAFNQIHETCAQVHFLAFV